jgi:hypothetical protein
MSNTNGSTDSSSTTTTTTTTNPHPLLDFCHKIASNAQELCKFLNNPNAESSITDNLRAALLAGDFDGVKAELINESPSLVETQVLIDDLRLNDGSTSAGWVLRTLTDQIAGRWTQGTTMTPPVSP